MILIWTFFNIKRIAGSQHKQVYGNNSGEFLSEIQTVPGIHFHSTFHLKSQVHFESFYPINP